MKLTTFTFLRERWVHWLEKRREAELARIQEQLTQAQWQNALSNHTHEADLAAGYNLSHFNTMQ
ncbi:MAG: hypothetical protein RIR73_212 [Chloroflexota bacterium]|jgi:hypothetical protein